MSATKSKTSYSPLGEIQPKFNRLFLVICLLFAFGIGPAVTFGLFIVKKIYN